jgi:hypothetical protein
VAKTRSSLQFIASIFISDSFWADLAIEIRGRFGAGGPEPVKTIFNVFPLPASAMGSVLGRYGFKYFCINLLPNTEF